MLAQEPLSPCGVVHRRVARRGFRWRRSAARDGLDISILQLGEGVFEVRSTNGDTHLSSDHFDQRIVDWLAEEFKRENGIDLQQDRLALQRLKEATERAKIELSSTTTTEINLPFITADAMGPKHLTTTLTRAKLEQLVGDLIERTADSLVYQAEKSLRDLGERVPADVRSDVQGRIAELKTAMQGRDVPAMRRASEELQRALRRIGERIYSQPAGAGIGGDGTTGTVEGAFREV